MYVSFCLYYGLNMFPADMLQTCRYLQHLSEFHQNVDSSRQYVGGMRALHEIFGFKPPELDHLYQLTASGIKRDKGHMVKQAAPITPHILAEIANMVNIANQEELAAWMAIILGFYLLFWKSNLVLDRVAAFSPHRQLTRSNYIRMKDCYVVQVYWSKTIQFHDRCLEIPMLPNPDLWLCPVYWTDLYFTLVPADPLDHAFSIPAPDGNQSLTYVQLTWWLKEWVSRLELDRTLYSLHSGAQWYAQSGLPHRVVKLLGDWKSAAYERYLDMTLQEHYDAMLVFNMSMKN